MGSEYLEARAGSPQTEIGDAIDSGERRLNALGYKQELRRKLSLFKLLAIAFSTMTLFTGIVPLYGFGILNGGAVGVVWGWVIVSFFVTFVGLAMAEICSSFPTTGSLYFWAAHLAGPRWGPLASWLTAWLEAVGLIFAVGTQAYPGAQTLQMIILLLTGTNAGGGYFAPKGVFVAMYIGLTLTWAVINTFAIEVIAYLDVISMYTQIVGATVLVVMLPLVAPTRQSASFVFTNFVTNTESTGVTSKAYSFILAVLMSQYSLFGYDGAAHLTEETARADINGPIAILTSIAIIVVWGFAFVLSLTFSIQGDPANLFDPNNETGGSFPPAQILYDAFHGRFGNSAGAIVFLFVIFCSFFFGGLSILTSASRVVYAFSRDGGIPGAPIWRRVHPRLKVPVNAVWLCAFIACLIGLPILRVNVVFLAITSVCTIGWMGGYAVPIFFRMIIHPSKFTPGPFFLGAWSRPICLVGFLWICYTCSVFLLPTTYPINSTNFNYAPVALGVVVVLVGGWWILDARKWFKGPVREIFVNEIEGGAVLK